MRPIRVRPQPRWATAEFTRLTNLARWDAALRDHALLGAREMQPALTPVQPCWGRASERPPRELRVGWLLDPYQGHPRVWHDGETVGFRTSIRRFPADHLTVVVLSTASISAPRDLALKIVDLHLKSRP